MTEGRASNGGVLGRGWGGDYQGKWGGKGDLRMGREERDLGDEGEKGD